VRLVFIVLAALVGAPRVDAAAPATSRSVSTTGPPARIVSLAPSVTETLFALGVGARVVAVSTYCDYPPEVERLPKVGSFLTPSVEAIVAQRPDVVIGAPSPGNHEAVAALRQLGIRVETPDPEHLADLGPVVRGIAAAAGVPEAGERLVVEIERGMDAVRERVAALPPRRVLMAIGQDPLIAVGETSFLGELIVAARGVNVAPPASSWPHVNVEYVIARDPEVIIDSSMGTEESSAGAGYWERLPSLTAVRERRVYAFRDYRALRPGPRLPAAFEKLARLIHPEAW
jgi:iron complex transport system substrate-binding protein